MDIFGVFSMVGGLALFLYGMSIMGNGLEKMSGGKLERILESLTSSPLRAVLLGAGVTAVIQSSSATTVMVVGFVNSGIMKFSQAIGIIMGANIGTTITAWMLSLTTIDAGGSFLLKMMKPSSFAPILALIGILLYMAAKTDKKKVIGEILLGFAILMSGMETMSAAVAPLKNVPEFTNILMMFDNPIMGILVGALLTAVIQSSSASVGILQALSVTGAFTYGSVIPIILGQNIGTCITAIISALGANRDGKRTAVVHLSFNIIGSVIFLVVFYMGNAIFEFPFVAEVVDAANIATIHTIFNVFATVALFPFIKTLEKLAYVLIPVSTEEKEMQEDAFAVLDPRFISSPAFAIEQCKSLADKMAEMTKDSFLQAMLMVKEPTEEGIAEVIKKENKVDVYDDKLAAYLTKVNGEDLSYADSLRATSLMHCLTDLERISDHAANVVECVQQMQKTEAAFSKKATEEMQVYTAALSDILDRTIMAFINGDIALAKTVEPLESVVDELTKTIKKNHMKRMNKGECTIELGLILSDLTMNYERVADHCSNIAVYTMQLQNTELEEHSFTEHMDAEEAVQFEKLATSFKMKYQI
ncbi:MAG: Na/Pi cotransporter family protein [Roseburia sp.]|nr:Na/Pi cotransporter family protein [Roseburia sp.]